MLLYGTVGIFLPLTWNGKKKVAYDGRIDIKYGMCFLYSRR